MLGPAALWHLASCSQYVAGPALLCGGEHGGVPDLPAAGTGHMPQREAEADVGCVRGTLPAGASSQGDLNLNLNWVSRVSVQSFICFSEQV